MHLDFYISISGTARKRLEEDIIEKKKKRDNGEMGIGPGSRGERRMKKKKKKGTQ